MSRLRGAVIGAGYFSQFHFDAWNRLQDVEIVAVCDRDEQVARTAADTYGIPAVFTDVSQLLNDTELDFVDIITRPDTHLEIVTAAARRGVNVICQKPLAPEFTESRRIVQIAEDAGIRFMVHENFRFQPWYREVRRLLDSGTIGTHIRTLSFRMRTGDGNAPDAYLARQPYFREMPRLLLHETGVHFIDTFRFLAGEVAHISATLRRINPVIAGEDAGLLTLEFESGAVGAWDANRCNESAATDPRYTFGTLSVETDGGTIRLDEEGRLFLHPLGRTESEHTYVHERRGFAGDCVFFTQKHFVKCLQSGTEFETSGAEYLKTLQLVEDAYDSAGPVGRPPGRRSDRRIVDLSLPVQADMRGVEITTATTVENDGWNATTLSLYSHSGTHMDAPKHFLGSEGATIDQQDLSVCCGPAQVVDLTPVEPAELLTVERLLSAGAVFFPGCRFLLRTDWDDRHGTDDYRDRLPRISPALAHWMADQQVGLIGVEAPSVADVNNLPEVTEVHQILFRGNVLIVEGLTGLKNLTQTTVEFIAQPLKITDGDGCPVRAIAIEENPE